MSGTIGARKTMIPDRAYWKARTEQIAAEVAKSQAVDDKVRQWVKRNIGVPETRR